MKSLRCALGYHDWSVFVRFLPMNDEGKVYAAIRLTPGPCRRCGLHPSRVCSDDREK